MVLDVFGAERYTEQKEKLFECLLRNKVKADTINKFRRYCINAEESEREYLFTWVCLEADYPDATYKGFNIEVNFITIQSPVTIYKIETSFCLEASGEITSRSSQASVTGTRYTMAEVLDFVKTGHTAPRPYTSYTAGTLR